MPSTLTFSAAMIRQVSAASNFGVTTPVSPWIRLRIIVTWPAPCIIGAIGKFTIGPPPAATFSASTPGCAIFSFE